MVKTLLVISLVLLVGAAGVTAAAAQGSQTGERIYMLKMWSEQARTLWQTRAQTQATQVTGQTEAEPGQPERDRLRLQTQDLLQTQERDRLRLQTQDLLQAQERDRIRLQTQDMQQTRERIQQSQNPGQAGQAGGNPWANDLPTTNNGNGPNPGQGNDVSCIPHSQNCNGGQSNPGYGNRP